MAIAFDAGTLFIPAGNQTSVTLAHIVSAGANTILLAGVKIYAGGNPADLLTGITYNGVAMTFGMKVAASGPVEMYLYYLYAPASGTHNIVATLSSGAGVALSGLSYTGVSQTGFPDASVSNGSIASPANFTLTTVANNAWLAGFMMSDNGSNMTAGTGTILRATTNQFVPLDSNGAKTPAGSYSLQGVDAGRNIGGIVVSLAPAITAALQLTNVATMANVSTITS